MRLADMDSLGVDVQILSTKAVAKMSRDANDDVSQLTKDHPT